MAGPTKAGTLLNAVTTTGRASIDLPLLPSMTLFFIKISGGTATVDLEISDDKVLFIKVVSVTANSSVQFAIPAAVVSANVSAISGATVTVTYRTVILDNMPAQTLVVYSGTTVTSPVISTTDHGALSGLGDDDHTQYLKEKASGGVAAEIPLHDHSSDDEGGTVSGGGGGSTITVAELDGTPSVASVDTVKFDQADGFSVTDNSDGSVTIGLSAGGAYSDEQAQDAVGSILDDGGDIDFTYDDVTPKITAVVKSTTITEAKQVLADNTTNDVSSTKHGYVPKSPADATKFLNGAATPAFALVKDSDLSTSDITTNDVSTSKHGFAPKGDGSTTKFLNANGAYSTPAGGGSGAWTLVEKKLITSNSTDVTFSGLDGNTDQVYFLVGRIKNASGATALYSWQPNGVTTNQTYQRLLVTGTSTPAASTGSVLAIHALNSGVNGVVQYTIHASDNPNSQATTRYYQGISFDTTPALKNYAGNWNESSTNITSIVIHSDQSNGLGNGTELVLYKLAQS